jgi:DoxX-like family
MAAKSNFGSLTWPIVFLQWAVGIVVLIGSLRTFFHSAHRLAYTSSHDALLPLLSGVELVGAILFLIPKTMRIGSLLLLVVFAIALFFHLAHGEWDSVSMLVVYAAAVIAVRANSGSGGVF